MKIDDEVSVAIEGGLPPRVFPAIVVTVWETEFDAIVLLDDEASTKVGRHFVDEGVRWCRGHSGPEVDALRAAQALR